MKQLFVLLSSFFLTTIFFSHKLFSQEKAKLDNFNFLHFFPDSSFANIVAEKLNKNIYDKVNTKELASIKGYFEVGPSEVESLKGIGFLIGIDSFNCFKNSVTEIPQEFGNLKNLAYLDLCKAFNLKRIPREIGKLKKLKHIRLALTEVEILPKEIGNLTELTFLMLCCNSLTEIPKEIGNLKKLITLDIHSNSIKKLPDEICNLISLNTLDVSHCGLITLPNNIGNLKELETLNLFNNNLKELPKTISNLTNLRSLNVFDNFQLKENYKKYIPKSLKKKNYS